MSDDYESDEGFETYSSADGSEPSNVMLGFSSVPVPLSRVLARQFPSTLGGPPAFLNPVTRNPIPKCKTCKKPLAFLAQVYSPSGPAFHRTIFLFACAHCEPTGSVVAVRQQLDRENPFFPSDPPSEPKEAEDEIILRDASEHFFWSPLEIEIEPEEVFDDSEEDRALVEKAQSMLADYNNDTEKHDTETNPDSAYKGLSELAVKQDKAFVKFCRRMEQTGKDQVIRYDYSATSHPLWVSSEQQAAKDAIPKCEACGAERWFEFQVLPQALYFLKTKAADAKAPELDFGTIAVYTCSASCNYSAPSEYVTEFVWIQAHSKDAQ